MATLVELSLLPHTVLVLPSHWWWLVLPSLVLQVRVDELRGEVARQKEAQQQLKSYYLSRINEQQAQTEAYRSGQRPAGQDRGLQVRLSHL